MSVVVAIVQSATGWDVVANHADKVHVVTDGAQITVTVVPPDTATPLDVALEPVNPPMVA